MSLLQFEGNVRKMIGRLDAADAPVDYSLPIGEERVPLNGLLGKTIRLAIY